MDNKLLTSLMLFPSILLTLFTSPYAQNCSSHQFRSNNVFATCNPLPVLNSFLHWTYHPDNHTVDLAYRHGGVRDSDWVAWALNLGGSGMVGSQCLIAFRNSSGQTHAYTSPISSYGTQLSESPLSFGVPRISSEFINNEMIIFATLELPSGRTNFNQRTGENMRSTGTVDFVSGQTSAGTGGGISASSRQRRRHVHGVLNAVSWGVMMPIGAIFARYLKVFKSADPAWFYLHASCQTATYTVGVAGWGTGLKLGSDSAGIKFTTHRNIGITLFCLGTLQVFALLLRPKPDHKYSLLEHLTPCYWIHCDHSQHHQCGRLSLLLEAITWFIVIKRKKTSVSDKYPHGSEANGYASRSHEQTA
ncbi:unnamed protein product [Withania somnifera]